MQTYDKDDLESVLRYLTGEYGVEILAGQGNIPGKNDVMSLLPDFFSTKHKGDYSIMRMMASEGVMKKLVTLKQSGAPEDECRQGVYLEAEKLKDNYIPEEVAAKFVNMIAGVVGLSARVSVKSSAAPIQESRPATPPAPTPQPAAKPKRPAISDNEFVKLCGFGTAREVEEALQDGANVDARDMFGRTALHEAAGHGKADVAEILLQHGAEDINAKDNNGSTALDFAQREVHSNVVKLLRKYDG